MNQSLRALNRYGLGARSGEAARIGDPQAWLRSQLKASPDNPLPAGLPTLQEIGGALEQFRSAGRSRDQAARRKAAQDLRDIAAKEGRAVLQQRIRSDAPFLERLVSFWSNHLCVSVAGKLPVVPLAGHYERTVIRPHALGRFEEMVLASARHPAMLLYLDNARSIGPSSLAGRRASRRDRKLGFNENYARELLELHTVGVDGGYTQEDVQQLAQILTGWTVSGVGPRSRGSSLPAFVFQEAFHQPGTKKVLGAQYRQEGVKEGEKVIRSLCQHPSTAKFLARKLVQHFVSDTPPKAALERIAATFRDTNGDLLKVSVALAELEEAWAAGNHKFRSPQDWLVAALRATGVREVPPRLGGVLQQLRQPLWAPPSPKGYGDAAQDWADPDSLMNRAELARSISRRLTRAGLDPGGLLEVVSVESDDPLHSMLGDKSIPADERLALAIGGPAFQWR